MKADFHISSCSPLSGIFFTLPLFVQAKHQGSLRCLKIFHSQCQVSKSFNVPSCCKYTLHMLKSGALNWSSTSPTATLFSWTQMKLSKQQKSIILTGELCRAIYLMQGFFCISWNPVINHWVRSVQRGQSTEWRTWRTKPATITGTDIQIEFCFFRFNNILYLFIYLLKRLMIYSLAELLHCGLTYVGYLGNQQLHQFSRLKLWQ